MDRTNPLISLAEVALFYGIALLVIWGGKDALHIPALVIAVLLVGICVSSNKFHGDTKERIGFSPDEFWPSLKMISLLAVPLMIPLYVYGWKNRLYWGWDLWFGFLGYPVWGFAQEYALLGFVGNRLEDGLPGRRWLVPWINGFLFAMAHLPNPVLMTVTFISGVLFTHVFFKHRQLLSLALIHALFGIGISLAFSPVYGIMSVGPGYIRRIGQLPY